VVSKRAAAAVPQLLAAAFLSAQFSSIASPINETGKLELTPADAIATVRVMQNQLYDGQRVSDAGTSPDGQRYLIRLAYGDVKRDGVWMDLLTGRLDSLDAAHHPRLCAHLFTTGLGSPTSGQSADADPTPANFIRWLDDTHVAFLWSDSHAHRQVMSVDLKSCKHSFLTASPTDVFSFASTAAGALLVNAQVPRPDGNSRQLWARGFTVKDSSDGFSILNGEIDGTNSVGLNYSNRWFLLSHGTMRSVEIAGNRVDFSNPFFRELSVSPSGRYAIVGVAPATAPHDWAGYQDPSLQGLLKFNETSVIHTPLSYALIDLRTGTDSQLWNSPKPSRCQVRWSPEGDTILLAPTFLPQSADSSAGLRGTAAAELDVRTGRYRVLPLDMSGRTVVSADWSSPTVIQIDTTDELGADPQTQRFTRDHGVWQATRTADLPLGAPTRASPIHIEIRQSLNSPPAVIGVDTRSGAERLILDTNPHLLERFKLGRVERLSGTLPNQKQWIGQLIYPADYQPGKHYPLVIQSLYGHGFGPEEFTLDGFFGDNGMGLGPSANAAYPGQLLATRNIAVLQLAVVHRSSGVSEAEDYQLAFETLAEQLSASGLADRNKIALDGFSKNGYFVEYTLSHSRSPFAAAIAADNYDPSYIQSALTNWRNIDEQTNGAPAFGDGLQQWLKRAPGFNAEHIRTPLRMIGQSAGVEVIMSKWEIYSRLHYLKKPVEMYLMPEADTHPSHLPQSPKQILAIQEGVLDWFSFWLSGREDPSPIKRDQYVRWRAFRASQTGPLPNNGKDP
jgi:dipeptidyl aminopeptidase/acylaminoacyl peptidase